MVVRNLFKFVSVRPPAPAAADDTCSLVNRTAGDEFVKEVEAWRKAHQGTSLRQARRTVSADLIRSSQYFARSDVWKDLRPLSKNMRDYLGRLCRTEGQNWVESRESSAAVLREQVRALIDDPDRFAEAKRIVWRSYYANALAPEIRPGDRPELLDWIRILAAVERLRPPQDEADWRYDAEGCACVARLDTARVNLPHELFVEPPGATPVPEKPDDSLEEDIARLVESIGRLRAARRNLDQFYRRRIGRLRLDPLPDDDDVVLRPPWLLTGDDADPLRDVATELRRLGLPFEGAIVPEVAQVLDEEIAADTAALTVLQTRVEVRGIGAQALARRTVRGLHPPTVGETAGESAS
ncbi:hypothetical protein HLK59_17670 [Streptomyces sp. S3(2020)]|uniref:hypothetical protein n=1 Tax=Streptomyces sp. S3(2020) TaxID=2732044 RepID=UPI001487CE3E|nr:hypothetical protein [Streptomyces sp. S3(2020)]NNN32158.1 hypothetical protein [Streptomyces sp. S3(2020)]